MNSIQKAFLNERMFLPLLAVTGAVLLLTGIANAGTTGAEFQGLYNLLVGWAQGYLARGIAIAASIAGALYGLAKQNPILAISGVVFAVILSVGPGIIDGILAATF